jgi:excisionase family DNA binding protein
VSAAGGRVHSIDDRLALSLAEAARALGVSERHVREILPDLPHVHLGRRVLIPVEALREWLRDRARAERSQAERAAEELVAAFTD